jgi:hypothetical protein
MSEKFGCCGVQQELRGRRFQRRRGARWERVKAASFHLIRKETERGWEQNDDVSALMPSLVRYGSDTGVADQQLRKRLLAIPLGFLEFETGLSRHTIVRARKGQPVQSRSLRLLKNAVRKPSIEDRQLTSKSNIFIN